MQERTAQRKDAQQKAAQAFAPACDPTNWELDNHPAYEDLDSTMRDFLRNRYKHWAPKVSWVYRLWLHLTKMHAHLAKDWPVRSKTCSEAEVKAARKKLAVDYFWDGALACPHI